MYVRTIIFLRRIFANWTYFAEAPGRCCPKQEKFFLSVLSIARSFSRTSFLFPSLPLYIFLSPLSARARVCISLSRSRYSRPLNESYNATTTTVQEVRRISHNSFH